MAIKRSVKVPMEDVEAATTMSGEAGEDFIEAALTEDQQSEIDTLEGHNAALRIINGSVPEINRLNHNVFKLKAEMSFREFLKMTPEEQKQQFILHSTKNNEFWAKEKADKAKAKSRKVKIGDSELSDETDSQGL